MQDLVYVVFVFFFFSSRRRHTRCALVTGVQTCALPILARRIRSASPNWAAPTSATTRGRSLILAITCCGGSFLRRQVRGSRRGRARKPWHSRPPEWRSTRPQHASTLKCDRACDRFLRRGSNLHSSCRARHSVV